jgi:hypothetical protein
MRAAQAGSARVELGPAKADTAPTQATDLTEAELEVEVEPAESNSGIARYAPLN